MPDKPARTLQKGEQPTLAEFKQIKGLMDDNPGLTGPRYKSLIEENVGVRTSIGTVYNWMKKFGVTTSRELSRNLPVLNDQERRRLDRLLKHLFIPLAEQITDGAELSRTGLDEMEVTRGVLRLCWDDEGVDFACWYTEEEAGFVTGTLKRMDKMRKTGLMSEFTLLRQETAGYMSRAISYQSAAALYNDRADIARWKMMRKEGQGSPPRNSLEIEAEWLLRTGRALQSRARKLLSEVRMAAGL